MNSKILERLKELEQKGALVDAGAGSAVERFAQLLTLAAINPNDPDAQKFNAILAEFNQHKVGDTVTESLKQKHSGQDQTIGKKALEAVLNG